MNKAYLGHLATFAAYTIFGINIIVCKDLTSANVLSPFALFTLRAVGATILFWFTSLFMPKEKVEIKDLPKIFIASMLGLFLTQLVFLKGITMATPLDSAIITTLSPILTMIVAAIAIKEPITLKKALGVALSFTGVIILILNCIYAKTNVQTTPLGVILLVLNSLFFAIYLGVFRPLISKYSVITFMKWMFLFALICSLPFNAKEVIECNWAEVPARQIFNLLFLVIMATFVAYFLIPIGQKHLRPTVVSLYSYIQPFLAASVSIYIGMDVLNFQKVLAAIIVVTGVVLVNKSRAKNEVNLKKQ